MSTYGAISNLYPGEGEPVVQEESPGTPRSRRKSRLLNMPATSVVDNVNNGANDANSEYFNSSSRRRRSTIGSSRMDPFGALLAEKDDDVIHSEKNISRVKKMASTRPTTEDVSPFQQKNRRKKSFRTMTAEALSQIPAIALIGIFHLMVGIPFGVSYFPMYWSSHPGESRDLSNSTTENDITSSNEEGPFPIPGKEALGIRMFLFSTFVGQVVFSCLSGFKNPIGLQMVENIGFTKELAEVAISHQGYGLEALSTVMIMFGIASLLVGIVFFLLGK